MRPFLIPAKESGCIQKLFGEIGDVGDKLTFSLNLPTTSVNCKSFAYLASWRETLDLRNFRMALANLSGPKIQASYTICLYHTSMGHRARSTFGALEVGGRCGQLAVVSYPSRVVRRPVAMVHWGEISTRAEKRPWSTLRVLLRKTRTQFFDFRVVRPPLDKNPCRDSAP